MSTINLQQFTKYSMVLSTTAVASGMALEMVEKSPIFSKTIVRLGLIGMYASTALVVVSYL